MLNNLSERLNFSKNRERHLGPSLLSTLLEVRSLTSVLSLTLTSPTLATLPKGDEHPVLVIPGFTAGDIETIFLRKYLKSRNYRVHTWNLGRNVGPNAGLEQRLVEKVKSLTEVYGKKVTLIGWSLGGIYARHLGHAVPEHVRQVISLGSPFAFTDTMNEASPIILSLLHFVTGRKTDELVDRRFTKYWRRTPPVPTTSIFSYTDGAVHWKSCIDPLDHERAENVRVPGSHAGLIANPLVFSILADRLAQDPDEWQPFEHKGSSRLLNMVASPLELMP